MTQHKSIVFIDFLIFLFFCSDFILWTIPNRFDSVLCLFFSVQSFLHGVCSPSHALLDHVHLRFHCIQTAERISADQHDKWEVLTPLRRLAKHVERHFVLKHQHDVCGRLRISVTFNLISSLLHFCFSHTQEMRFCFLDELCSTAVCDNELLMESLVSLCWSSSRNKHWW